MKGFENGPCTHVALSYLKSTQIINVGVHEHSFCIYFASLGVNSAPTRVLPLISLAK